MGEKREKRRSFRGRPSPSSSLSLSLSLYVFLTVPIYELYRDDDLKFIHLPSSTKDASTWIEKDSPCIFQMFNIHPIGSLSSLYMSWICPKGKIQTHASL
jgi:hypothetical protein